MASRELLTTNERPVKANSVKMVDVSFRGSRLFKVSGSRWIARPRKLLTPSICMPSFRGHETCARA
jgi:hypothetical protein